MPYYKDSTGQVFFFDYALRPEQMLDRLEALTEDEANAILNAPKPPVVPKSITRRQAKQALAINGLLANVQPAIDAIEDDLTRTMAQIAWDDSLEFERTDSTLLILSQMLGLTDEQLDQLFILGATL